MRDSFPLGRGRHHFFPKRSLQRRIVQHGVGQQPLQPRVLVLQRLQPLGFRDLHPAELRFPFVDAGVADAVFAAQIGDRNAGLDEGLAYTAQWFGIADTVTANVSTDFAALTGSTDEAKIIGDAQKRNVISAKTERSELKRRGILGPDFKEEDEEQRLAEEQEGLLPEQPIDPVSGKVFPFEHASTI
jgi:hypothetical protein